MCKCIIHDHFIFAINWFFSAYRIILFSLYFFLFKKMMILHIKRCLPTEYSFPPENPVWCRKNESHFVISCCQDHDFCNTGKRLKLLPQDRAKDQSGKHKSSKSKNSVLCKKKKYVWERLEIVYDEYDDDFFVI